ncbi:MAG: thioesterase family protein [Trueperaceae bacterium]|nr:MAG: thioesterase family protein [Trueperaceae bacterium]
MRSIPIRHAIEQIIAVTPEMTVDFEQNEPGLGKLHPVYATYWLTKHFELASRKLVLPYLDDDEESIGFEVQVKHLASTLPGMNVRIVSQHRTTKDNRIYIDCEAFNELGDKIAEGSTTQVVLARKRLVQKFAELRERWEAQIGTKRPNEPDG